MQDGRSVLQHNGNSFTFHSHLDLFLNMRDLASLYLVFSLEGTT